MNPTPPAAVSSTDIIVITGAGGMGIAIARRIGTGRHVVIADISASRSTEVAELLRGEGHRVTAIATDVSVQADVEALADGAAALGPIRAIVHTAGLSPVQSTPAPIVAVDVLGTAYVLDAFVRHLQPGTAGVCIASMAGTMTELPPEVLRALALTPAAELAALPILDPSTMDPGSAYGIAKRANHVRVRAASVAWGAKGGRVNTISPGIISTPMGQQELSGPSGDIMRHMTDLSAMKRLGTPEDIAMTVEFLISPQASFITGTDVLVDGGVVAALTYGS